MLRACFAVQADSVHHPCACAWAKQLKHWELKRNRTEWQTSAWWACPFELMGLKCVYVERSSIRGPWGPLPQRLPVPPRTAHHHIQMKCKSPLSPLSAMSIPLWLLLSPYQFSISLLLRLFSFFILILCLPLLPSALFVFRHRFPISHFSTLPVSLPDGCRLQPTKVRRVYLLFYLFFLEWLWVISH